MCPSRFLMKYADSPPPWHLLILFAGLACDFSDAGLSRSAVPAAGAAGSRSWGSVPPAPNYPPPPDDPIPGVLPPDAAAPMDAGPTSDAGVSSDARPFPDAAAPAPAPPALSPPPPTPPPPTIDCPDDDNLRLCLRFERNLRNESPNDLAVGGNQISFEPGLPGAGSAIRIGDGTEIRVSMTGGAVNITTFTVEAWIRLDRLPDAGDRATVVDRRGRYTMSVLPDGTVACANGPHRVVSGPGAVTAGVWVSLACTADDRQVAVWLSGVVSASAAAGPNQAASMGGLSVGRAQSDDDPMTGLLDNVRLWDHVRRPDQICAAAIGCR
jgi:hypothetical protein